MDDGSGRGGPCKPLACVVIINLGCTISYQYVGMLLALMARPLARHVRPKICLFTRYVIVPAVVSAAVDYSRLPP